MKTINKIITMFSVVAVVAVGVATDTSAQRPSLNRGTVTRNSAQNVPAGKRIRVRMNAALSSKVSKVGDTFVTTVTEPVYSNSGAVVIPTGSEIIGRVDSVKPAKKGGNVGEIDVSFRQLVLPNGTRRTINGSLTDLNEDDAKSDSEGTARGDRTKNRKIIFIGGGGAGGAVLGAAIGGGKGALIGGLIGAGAGFLGEKFTKGEEAEVKAGTEFGIILNQAISLPRFAEAGMDEGPYDGPTTGGTTYVVRPGDTLAKISIRFYGTSSRYMDIYNANRDRLSSPSNISVGQTLVIP